jgi:NTP pyrophosphatase (non-canonical NTP hydrolase)
MTRKEHLLLIAMEECNEVAHRISKALRFTLDEVQPGQDLNNAQRIHQEFNDLMAVMQMLVTEFPDMNPGSDLTDVQTMIEAKKAKIEKFLKYSEQKGTL